MSNSAHIIDIDHLVLSGIDPQNPELLSPLIEAEVLGALNGIDLGPSTSVSVDKTRVAGEVAGAVVRSIQGGSDGF